MVCDLRVPPETAPPSFEKGISCLTCHHLWCVRAPFLSREGAFYFFTQKGMNIMVKLVENPIDPASVYDSICSAFSGSVVFHYAVVKKTSRFRQ